MQMGHKVKVESYVFDLETDGEVEAYRRCLEEIANNGYKIIENIIFAKKVGDVTFSKKLLSYKKYISDEDEE